MSWLQVWLWFRSDDDEEVINEAVMTPCKYCGTLFPQIVTTCPNCGAKRKA